MKINVLTLNPQDSQHTQCVRFLLESDTFVLKLGKTQ